MSWDVHDIPRQKDIGDLMGAIQGDYEANGAVRMAPDQFDCGLEDHLPAGWGRTGD
jgi:hypothetical protein